MKPENTLTTTRAGTEVIEFVQPSEPPAPHKPANPLVVAHSLLRGRYGLATTLAVVGAAIGAPVGYLLQQPEYKSTGIVEVLPYVENVLDSSKSSGFMPAFDQFLQKQAALISSRRVTGDAQSQSDWKPFRRTSDPAAEAEFQQNIEVMIPKGTSMIRVSATNSDPKAAAAAVTAVLNSYIAIAESDEDARVEEPMRVADGHRSRLKLDIDGLETRITQIHRDLKTASPEEDYDHKRRWLYELQRDPVRLRAAGAARNGQPGPATAPTSQPVVLSAIALASRDQVLARLENELDSAERDVQLLSMTYGEANQQVKLARKKIELLERDAADRVNELNRTTADGVSRTAPNQAPGMPEPTAEELQQAYVHLAQEVETLGNKVMQIKQFGEQKLEKQKQLSEVDRKIELHKLERQLGGRISIMSVGDVPYAPTKDRRRALAAVGAMGMAGLGVGFVMLLGFLDRRMHHIDTARSRLKPAERLLGVLPELSTDFADPVAAADTAHCVHRIRAMLQIRQRATGHKTFAITSPAPGDGKTSLTITLGMSLASSGCRTLLVDCDMDGGGLSAKLGREARRQLGQILLDEGLLGEASLQEAVDYARQHRVRLGTALVKLRHVTQVQIDLALLNQRAAAPGLCEVLNGEPSENAVHATAYPSLSVLPLSVAAGAQAGKFAPEALHRVLSDLSERFDVVLIDCGPILGSIEASIVAAEADGVVLIVSRGGDRKAADNAVGLLTTAGASIEGVVFNRALPDDVSMSGFSSSSSRRAVRSNAKKSSAAAASPSAS